eukprot:XP_001706838.1 Hypothetical protein GL50803_32148 [Giardia lamblia ATCC 50803]
MKMSSLEVDSETLKQMTQPPLRKTRRLRAMSMSTMKRRRSSTRRHDTLVNYGTSFLCMRLWWYLQWWTECACRCTVRPPGPGCMCAQSLPRRH